MKWKNYKRWLAFVSGFASLLGATADAVELKSETAAAFDRYVHATERRMEDDLRADRFLVVNTLPEIAREQVYAELKRGQFYIAPLRSKENGKPIPVPGGLIHHWVGVAFIPGVTLSRTLAVLQDYDNHKAIYKPDVRDSKLLSCGGNDFKVFLQFYRKSAVTVVVNVNLDIQYSLLGTARATSKSYSTRISEVENAGQQDEHELPVGNDHGYVWRLYSYWRIEEKDGGTYIQVESVGLSRTIPWAIAWLVDPLTRSIPRNVLFRLLDSTRIAVQSKAEPHTHSTLSKKFDHSVAPQRSPENLMPVRQGMLGGDNSFHASISESAIYPTSVEVWHLPVDVEVLDAATLRTRGGNENTPAHLRRQICGRRHRPQAGCRRDCRRTSS